MLVKGLVESSRLFTNSQRALISTSRARPALLSSGICARTKPSFAYLHYPARQKRSFTKRSSSDLFRGIVGSPLTLSPPLRPSNTMSDSKPAVPTGPPHPWPSPSDWPASKVRQTFIDYFVNQPGFEHTFWASSGVIPFDDDTLLFANAVSPPHLLKWLRPTLRSTTGYEPVQAPLPRHC